MHDPVVIVFARMVIIIALNLRLAQCLSKVVVSLVILRLNAWSVNLLPRATYNLPRDVHWAGAVVSNHHLKSQNSLSTGARGHA